MAFAQANVQFLASLVGRVKGVSGNSEPAATLNGRTFNLALGLTGTSGATYANNGVHISTTLATTATVVYDLRSFRNHLGETTQALDICRLFYIKHDGTSPAASIHVGDSGANGFKPLGAFGTTAAVMLPGAVVVLEHPTLVGMTVNATAKDLKIVASGTTHAVYTVGWWGEDAP